MDTDEVKAICSEYKIHNCDIIFREDCTADQLIDVIEGNRSAAARHAGAPSAVLTLEVAGGGRRGGSRSPRIYIPCIYCLNKIDQISIEVRPHCPGTCALHPSLSLTDPLRTRAAQGARTSQELDLLQRVPHTCPISAHHEWNFDELLDMAWTYLDLVRM